MCAAAWPVARWLVWGARSRSRGATDASCMGGPPIRGNIISCEVTVEVRAVRRATRVQCRRAPCVLTFATWAHARLSALLCAYGDGAHLRPVWLSLWVARPDLVPDSARLQSVENGARRRGDCACPQVSQLTATERFVPTSYSAADSSHLSLRACAPAHAQRAHQVHARDLTAPHAFEHTRPRLQPAMGHKPRGSE